MAFGWLYCVKIARLAMLCQDCTTGCTVSGLQCECVVSGLHDWMYCQNCKTVLCRDHLAGCTVSGLQGWLCCVRIARLAVLWGSQDWLYCQDCKASCAPSTLQDWLYHCQDCRTGCIVSGLHGWLYCITIARLAVLFS